MSRTIARYCDTGSLTRRQGSGRKSEIVRKVKKRRSDQKMARKLNISQYAIRQILKNELGEKSLKCQKVQDLTEAQKS